MMAFYLYTVSVTYFHYSKRKRNFEVWHYFEDNIKSDLTSFTYELTTVDSEQGQYFPFVNAVMNIRGLKT
jgi:hypothetical protein